MKTTLESLQATVDAIGMQVTTLTDTVNARLDAVERTIAQIQASSGNADDQAVLAAIKEVTAAIRATNEAIATIQSRMVGASEALNPSNGRSDP